MDYMIRIPLKMIQYTEEDGKTWPLAFDWQSADGAIVRVPIDRIFDVVPAAEIRSGTVGDRYECEIEGQREYLYYTKLAPRKWFRLTEVSEEEYMEYYALSEGRSYATRGQNANAT